MNIATFKSGCFRVILWKRKVLSPLLMISTIDQSKPSKIFRLWSGRSSLSCVMILLHTKWEHCQHLWVWSWHISLVIHSTLTSESRCKIDHDWSFREKAARPAGTSKQSFCCNLLLVTSPLRKTSLLLFLTTHLSQSAGWAGAGRACVLEAGVQDRRQSLELFYLLQGGIYALAFPLIA